MNTTVDCNFEAGFYDGAMYVFDLGVSYSHKVLILNHICPKLSFSIASSPASVVMLQINTDLGVDAHSWCSAIFSLQSHPYHPFSWKQFRFCELLSVHACIGVCVLANP
jgi:hypothetical protein